MERQTAFEKWAICEGFPMAKPTDRLGYYEPTNSAYLGYCEGGKAAYGYASRLLQTVAPKCTPLDTTEGVLTQLDNYIVGQKENLDKASNMLRRLCVTMGVHGKVDCNTPLYEQAVDLLTELEAKGYSGKE